LIFDIRVFDMPEKDGRANNGGRRENSGRSPGTPNFSTLKFRELARRRSPAALNRMWQLACQNDDLKVAFNATRELMYWAHGKPREHVTVENQDTLSMRYQTLDEIKQELIANGLPIDHLEKPKLIEIEHKPSS
jgi:hypothetical protein